VPLDALLPGAQSASNLWGLADLNDQREYAVIGVSNGTAVVDVTDPASPRVVGAVPGPESIWREVKVFQRWNAQTARHEAYAYVVSEAPTAGLQILDLSGLPDAVSLASTFRAFDTSHTVTIANVDPATGAAADGGPDPLLYVQGARTPTVGIFALGLADPVQPTVLGQYTLSYGHDTWTGRAEGVRAGACRAGHDPCDVVVAWTGRDLRVLDWTEKASPQVIAQIVYPDIGYPHSGWISRDGRFLFSMDELDERLTGKNSRVRVFDVSDWSHPLLAAAWTSRTKSIEHNGYTRGDRYYMSHYERGLTVLDVSNPLTPVEQAFFDTFPAGEGAEYHGAWGVYPYLPSGTILVSNIDGAGGLFVLRASTAPEREPIVPVPPRRRARVVDAPRPIP
jgi:choice-of-anchor B domain-containing protein